MQDRLRRLDSLFAEKVLGYRVVTEGPTESGAYYGATICRQWPTWKTGELIVLGAGHVEELPTYTRSLDAAWEGAANLWSICVDTPNGKSHAWIYDKSGAFVISDAYAPHPAEALVLACLRAAGVAEEELK